MRHTTPRDRLEWLRQIPGLRGSPDRELEKVARLIDDKEVPAGYVLAREGTTAREAFVIAEGWAMVTISDRQVATLGPGSFVGELAMLDRGTRTATVVAQTPMRLLVIGPSAFPTLLALPSVATGLSRALAGRLRDTDSQLAASPPPP
jgi:CRP-like cAMP-binding protein